MKNHILSGTVISGACVISLMAMGGCRSHRHATADSNLRLNQLTADSTASVSVRTISELLVTHSGIVIDSPVITVTAPSGHTVSLKASRLRGASRVTHETGMTDSTLTVKTSSTLNEATAHIHEVTDMEASTVSPPAWWWLLLAIPLTCWLLYKRPD